MDMKEIKNPEEWDNFIFSQPFYTFMNSWAWGEFNKLSGSKIFRLGFYDKIKGSLQSVVLMIKVNAKRGTHLFCPYGPIIRAHDKKNICDDYLDILGKIIGGMKKICSEENACFLRINPPILSSRETLEKFKKIGFKFAPMHVHAEDTWLLDLSQEKSSTLRYRDTINLPAQNSISALENKYSDDEMLRNMRKTTRYMIKRAEKEGVVVEKNNSKDAILKFIQMHKSHAIRDKGNQYVPFSNEYIFNLFKVFPDQDINLMYAYYLDENIGKEMLTFTKIEKYIEAMLVSIKYGKTTAYYLGASDIRHPKFSPAYILQWEAIKKARHEGCAFYNFWGVAPDDNPRHPLSGVSLFKKGFGGYNYRLLHVQDMPISCNYWINWAVESLRRVKRGYYYKVG